jgi:hypothetical protein
MRLTIVLLLLATLMTGCAAPWTTGAPSTAATAHTAVASPATPEATQHDPRAAAIQKATASTPLAADQALAGVLDELEEIRAIDPEAQKELMADLREANPEHYPMIVEAFRTALAYRQQLSGRQQALAGDAPETTGVTPASYAAAAQGASPVEPAPIEAPPVSRVAERPAPIAAEARHSAQQRLEQGPASVAGVAGVASGPVPLEQAPRRQPVGPAASAIYDDVEAIAADAPASPAVHLASIAQPAEARPWRSELAEAIEALEREVAEKPTSVEQLDDHMRLSLLRLAAGREEDAYGRIPGASAAQQDYWSKQLFAISAYLDGASRRDDKQRATAALIPLDEARAKLSELATLQIRNAAFVSSVAGYGAYEPRKAVAFGAGQKVTLYAEVENFRSEPAEDGFHTSLASSYQVVDSEGRRVDGKQFPDVADSCRNRRRDFHMQYEFPLPTRIYPGDYKLELTITDHNSGKIGQATIPFSIEGER